MKKLKKLFAVAAASVVSAVLFTVVASASITGTVNVSNYLNVRSAGNTGAPIIGKLYNGAQVTVTNSVNGWDEILYGGRTGWVSGQYIVTGKAQAAVSAAKSQLGVPYVYGAAIPYKAFDCSGLTMYAYGRAGVTLPHSAASQSAYGWWVSRSSLKPGDLLFFSTDGSGRITHCGIYIGNNMFISAQSGAGSVKEASLGISYWSNAYVTARRITN